MRECNQEEYTAARAKPAKEQLSSVARVWRTGNPAAPLVGMQMSAVVMGKKQEGSSKS